MTGLLLALPIILHGMAPKPFPVRFVQSAMGRNVTISIDGGKPRATFAGKLGFRDASHEWMSVCANPRAPISAGQAFRVRTWSTLTFGGSVKLAGNIVSRSFRSAMTADQCAGLQLAVWEAIEDGGWNPDFSSGHFRVNASAAVLAAASDFYAGLGEDGDAIFLQSDSGGPGGAGGGGGQDQLTT